MPRIIKKEDIQNHPQIPGFQIKSVTETLNQDSKVMEVKQLILDPNIISPEFTHNGYDQLLYVIKGDGIAGIIYRSKNNLIDIFKEFNERKDKGHISETIFIGINSALIKEHKKINDFLNNGHSHQNVNPIKRIKPNDQNNVCNDNGNNGSTITG